MTVLERSTLDRRQAAEVTPLVYRIPTGISNCYLVRVEGTDEFVLIDAAPPGYGRKVLATARELFGDKAPRAILLTHGHFDHAGSLPELLEAWDVAVLAHPLELPYLNEGVRYPPGDPTVGGMMAELSRFVNSSRPTAVPREVRALAEEGAGAPQLPGWQVVHCPGHTPGHVAYWHPGSRTLLAGDAVITCDMDHPVALAQQRPVLSRPPAYATYNWWHAGQSVKALADLEPTTIAAGHGVPMSGPQLAAELHHLAADFPAPRYGRYVHSPARFGKHGPTFIPPKVPDPVKAVTLSVLAAVAVMGTGWYLSRARRPQSPAFVG